MEKDQSFWLLFPGVQLVSALGLGFGNEGLEECRGKERSCLGYFCLLDGYSRNRKVRNRADASVSSCLMVSFSSEVSNLKVKVQVTLMSTIRV